MPENKKISIILPVFNAPDDLKRCLESVRLHTSTECQIIIINDCSTDPQIPQIIQDFKFTFPNCLTLENSENLGFVKTCNRAFREAHGTDVILLNSDTIVTEGWIRKLSAAAYAFPKVATVTPLTNNGTVCSIPTWLEENTLPEGFSTEEYADFVENISLKVYPSIPTAIGFCMYITRDALDEVGVFNEEQFGKGYGEENDWCYRASMAGYYHIVDDATFIYHAGSKSFGPEKLKILEENFKKIEQLHPSYHQDVADFIRDEPFNEVLENVKLRLKIHNLISHSPVCFVLHTAIFNNGEHPPGGTEFYCQELSSIINQERPVYVIYPDRINLTLNVEIYFKGEVDKFRFKCTSLRFENERFLRRDPTFQKLLSSLFSVLQPSVLHIHHLLGFSLMDMTSVIKSVDIPVFLSLHDFYFICPSYKLIDSQKRFCADYKDDRYCASCISKLYGQGSDLQKRWHGAVQALLSSVDLVFSPSLACADLYKQEYPDFAEKIVVVPHGLSQSFVRLLKSQNSLKQSRQPSKNKLCVGFVGGVNKPKGSEIIHTLIKDFWQEPRLRDRVLFKIIGSVDIGLPENCKNYTVTGEYGRADLAQYLPEIDIAVFPSQWAETYCLTADEVLVSGVPLVTTPIGAVPERVNRSQAGWVTEDLSAQSIKQVIYDCLENPAELAEKTAYAEQYEPLDLQAVCEIYLQYYSKLEKDYVGDRYVSQPFLTVKSSVFNRLFLQAHETYAAKVEESQLVSNVVVLDRKKVVSKFYFLKERFPRVWNYVRLRAFRMGVIK